MHLFFPCFIFIEPQSFAEHMTIQKKNSQPLLQMTVTIEFYYTQVRYQLGENQHVLFVPFSSMPLPPSCCLKCGYDGWISSCIFGS